MLAVVFWGSHERWIWKQWQTLWYGLVRLQRGRKLEQKDLVKESSSRVGPPLYSIKDECLKKYKLGRAWWRGNRPGEAIWRLMTIPFWKRSGVCQNRWQLVKKIKRRYYCFQHHFRLVSPPPHQTQTNTHTMPSLTSNCFLSSDPKNTQPCVTLALFFRQQDGTDQSECSASTISMFYPSPDHPQTISDVIFFVCVGVYRFHAELKSINMDLRFIVLAIISVCIIVTLNLARSGNTQNM